MTVYLVILLLCAAMGLFLCEKRGRKTEYLCVLATAALLCALAALRSGEVGVDYDWIYRDYFLSVRENLRLDFIFSPQNAYRHEFVFTLLNMAVALFTDEPLVFWGISSVIIVLLQTAFFLRFSAKPWLSIYLFIALGFFGYSLCYIRQMLAVSAAFYALPFIKRKNFPAALVFLIIAGFIHNSLFLLIPLCLLARLPFNRLTAALYALGYGIMLIFSDELILLFTEFSPRFSLYVENGVFKRGLNFQHAFIWMVMMAVLLICFSRAKAVSPDIQPLFSLCLFGTLIIMLISKSAMYQRLSLVLLPFFTLLIPEVAAAFYPNKTLSQTAFADEKRFYYTMLLLFMAMALFRFLFEYSVDTLRIYPYIPFWR